MPKFSAVPQGPEGLVSLGFLFLGNLTSKSFGGLRLGEGERESTSCPSTVKVVSTRSLHRSS